MLHLLVALSLSAPPSEDCKPVTSKVGHFTPTADDVSAALRAAKGGMCEGCLPMDTLDAGLRACGAAQKSPLVAVEVKAAKCAPTKGSACEGMDECRCSIDVNAAEWKGRRFLRLVTTPVADYTVDVFELKGKKLVSLVSGFPPYNSALCGDGDLKKEPKTPLKTQWATFPKDLKLFFCNSDG